MRESGMDGANRSGYTQRVSSGTHNSGRLARRILWGLVAGVVLGAIGQVLITAWPDAHGAVEVLNQEALWPFGQIFLRLLMFVVVPLVFSSLTLGIVQLQRLSELGALAWRTFALFGLNMAIGVTLGLLLLNLLQPGHRLAPETRDKLIETYRESIPSADRIMKPEAGLSPRQLVERFMPRNLLRSVVDFELLPMILFSLLVGAAATQLPETQRRQTQNALEIVSQLMVRLVHYALLLAPYGVAALVASVILSAGLGVLRPLAWFVGGVLFIMVIHLFGVMSVLLKLLSRRSPGRFFRAVRPVLVTAFSTSSSNATLPTSLQVCREMLGVSASTSGFVLPLGATMNMSGTALYEGCVVLFIAQVYGVHLTLAEQATLVVLAVLSAVAVAGIPGASLPLIMGLLATFHVPPEGIALILGFDRLLDMARTTVNVGADLVTACILHDRLAENASPSASGP